MGKFINPFTDTGFKKIFGKEVNKDLLINFLNSLLVGERHILDIELLDKEHHSRFRSGRNTIYDIYCRTDSGEYIIVEMQNAKQDIFIDRMLFYTMQSLTDQGQKGTAWRYGLSAVYSVAFMNFKDDKLDDFRTDIYLKDQSNKVVSWKLRMIFLQLPLFEKDEPSADSDYFDKWIYVLKNMETFSRMPYAAQDAVFKKLESIATLAELSPAERRKYDHDIKVYRDNLMFEEQDRRHIEEAEKRGEERGEKRGEKKGMEKGIEIGRAEKMEALCRTAKYLLSINMPVDQIAQGTGLGVEQIEEIKKNMA